MHVCVKKREVHLQRFHSLVASQQTLFHPWSLVLLTKILALLVPVAVTFVVVALLHLRLWWTHRPSQDEFVVPLDCRPSWKTQTYKKQSKKVSSTKPSGYPSVRDRSGHTTTQNHK
jgi:hypothetical protein